MRILGEALATLMSLLKTLQVEFEIGEEDVAFVEQAHQVYWHLPCGRELVLSCFDEEHLGERRLPNFPSILAPNLLTCQMGVQDFSERVLELLGVRLRT